jgi:D-alanyl-D-alanine dipeptidase
VGHRGCVAATGWRDGVRAGILASMNFDPVRIAPPAFDVEVALAYATAANITGKPVYRNASCWLHRAAAERLAEAIRLARPLGLRFKVFDALRPTEAQWKLWEADPNPEFLADPRRGSPHSRGVAVDLTLIDAAGVELDMGTGFDAFTPLSHHGVVDIPAPAQRNRLVLMGLMTAAGWDFYRNEWWHYQLFDARRYPLVADADLPEPMM